jgi:hypothetical protein
MLYVLLIVVIFSVIGEIGHPARAASGRLANLPIYLKLLSLDCLFSESTLSRVTIGETVLFEKSVHS